ncbi:MAG TPA: class I SAM-dependent methyltransferase [Jatrophihabitans sp.]|jgi:SAM-dependent methyltransferase|nr:class I SAM-dependent methyltransferase [Jatrophihabitans sp.]
MTAVRVSSSWLALREPADAVARAVDLVAKLQRHLPGRRPLVVHDLACGTGSMLRWLAPRLAGPQHWVCHDLDADLLAETLREQRPQAADGSAVTVDVRQGDVTRLAPGECVGAALITTSALLDLLTADELDRLVATCMTEQSPALLSLSVTGRVELRPPHPLDAAIADAFNAHQRRSTDGRQLLGPDAAAAAVRAFRSFGCDVVVRTSPWRLGAESSALTSAWLTGWLSAACEQRPELTAHAAEYARQRHADAAAGRLRVLVQHRDLLVLPRRGPR